MFQRAVLFAAVAVLSCSSSISGQNITRLTEDGSDWERPSVDSRGKLLLYVGNQSLFIQVTRTGVSGFLVAGGVNEARISGNRKFAAFSGSGDYVGTNADGNEEVFLHDIRKFSITQLTDTGATFQCGNPTIDRKGRWIAFISDADLAGANADGNEEIFLYHVGSAAFTQVTDTPPGLENEDPAIAANGRYVYFSSRNDLVATNGDNNREIFRYVVKTGSTEQLTNTTSGNSRHPVPSKNGRLVAFESDSDQLSGANADGFQEIYRLDTNKGTLLRLTDAGFASERPSICGNGKSVTFESAGDPLGTNADGSRELFLVRVRRSGLEVSQVTSGAVGTESRRAVLDHSGRRIFFQSDADLAGGGPGTEHVFCFSPSSTKLNVPGGRDTFPPTAPTGLSATAVSSSRVDLVWNASSDDVGVQGYSVYRDGKYLETVTGTSTSDTGLSPGDSFCYSVSAHDSAGNESGASASDCATTVDWVPRLSGTDMDHQRIVWTGSQFLVVGDDQETLTSPDGVNWTSHSGTFTTPLSLTAVVWTGSQFVGARSFIYTSPDGIDWTIQHPQGSRINGMAWSGSTIVAVGETGLVLTSPDGVSWSSQDSGTTEWLNDVIWDGGQFVAVGEMGTILTSPNGTGWTARTSGTTNTLNGLTWSGSQFVAVGLSAILTSPDGITWTTQTPAGNLEKVAWSDTLGLFAAVGWYNGGIATSPDGMTWTTRTNAEFYTFNDVVWNGAQFVAVGDFGEIATSPDGVAWTTRLSGSDLENIIWTGSQFLAVGGYGKTLTSPDGISWTYGTTGENGDFLRDITWSGTRYVAGAQSYVLSSSDAVTWPQRDWLGATSVSDGVAWSGTRFVSVEDYGGIQTSPDGLTWTFQTSGTTEELLDVTWSGSRFVVAGFNGTILTSTDGVAWSLEVSGTAQHLRGVAWSGSRFVAVGDAGTILTSPDAITWSQRTSGTTNLLREVIWTGTSFVTVGNSNTILTSADGVTWTPSIPSVNYGNLRGVAWSGSRLVVVGVNSRIITLP